MSEEIKNNSVEQVAAAAPAEDTTPVEESKPFKVYSSEDEYKKELQSVASKAKFALLQELNLKNLEEARAKFTELEFTKSELKALNDVKAELDAAKSEKQKLSENLLMTELGVKTELRDDFLVLAKNKVSKDLPLEDAAKSVLEKYTYFKGSNDVAAQVAQKIGTEKKPQQVDFKEEEKKRLMKLYPHLKL
jgi:hypothetical protein